MATDAAPRPLAAPRLRLDRLATRVGLLVFIAGIGYLTIVPLVRLQYLALRHGAQPYHDAYTREGWGQTVRWTIELGLGSLAIALVLGTSLAWAANSLPPRLSVLKIVPILPIVIPAVSSVLGWAFLLSPHPGYLNQLLRLLPWWHHQFEGPFDIYSVTWIVIITGLSLASFIYLFVSSGFENINGELIEAAQVGGSSRAGVFFRVIAAAAPPFARLRRRRRAAARARAVHRAAPARPYQEHLRPHDRHVPARRSRSRRTTDSPQRSARRCSSSASSSCSRTSCCSATSPASSRTAARAASARARPDRGSLPCGSSSTGFSRACSRSSR